MAERNGITWMKRYAYEKTKFLLELWPGTRAAGGRGVGPAAPAQAQPEAPGLQRGISADPL